jgi:hypothetical protein
MSSRSQTRRMRRRRVMELEATRSFHLKLSSLINRSKFLAKIKTKVMSFARKLTLLPIKSKAGPEESLKRLTSTSVRTSSNTVTISHLRSSSRRSARLSSSNSTRSSTKRTKTKEATSPPRIS